MSTSVTVLRAGTRVVSAVLTALLAVPFSIGQLASDDARENEPIVVAAEQGEPNDVEHDDVGAAEGIESASEAPATDSSLDEHDAGEPDVVHDTDRVRGVTREPLAERIQSSSANSLVAEGVQPGETRAITFEVQNATAVNVVIVKPEAVEARLLYATTSSPWRGAGQFSTTLSMSGLNSVTGQFTVEVRNPSDRVADVQYEYSWTRSGSIVIDPRVSTDLNRLEITAFLDGPQGGIRGASVTAVVTGDNGVWTSHELAETAPGQYTATVGPRRASDYTVAFRTTIDGVVYTASALGRIVGTNTVPPVVEFATEPAQPNEFGWFTGSVDVTISASDPNGVLGVWYRVNGGPVSQGPESVQIALTHDGVNTIEAWAWDALHNISKPVHFVVNRDSSAPEISRRGALQQGRVAIGATAPADFACVDEHSDIVSCVLRIDGGGVLQPGDPLPTSEHARLEYRIVAVNSAGLETESDGELRVTNDSTPPTLELLTVPETANARGWFSSDVTVRILASDTGSGTLWTQYRIGSEPWHLVNDAEVEFEITTDGESIISYRAADRDGNQTGDRTRSIRLDRVAPRIEIHNPIPGLAVQVGDRVNVEYSCDDDVSGVFSCVSTVAHGTALPTDTPGRYEVRVTAIDNAGNLRVETVEYTVLAPPLGATLTPSVEANADGWWNDEIVLTIAAVAQSGAERVHWQLEGAQTATGSASGTGTVRLTAEGRTRVSVWAEDAEGSMSEPVTREFALDRTAPLIEWIHDGPRPPFSASAGPVGLEFELGEEVAFVVACTDYGGSGIEVCFVANDGILDTSTVGVQRVSARAVDRAGNETYDELVYRVVGASTDPTENPTNTPSRNPAGELASTGASVAPIGALIVVLAVIGLLLVRFGRRRAA